VQLGAAAEQGVNELAAGVEAVLAVVEDHQDASPRQVTGQPLDTGIDELEIQGARHGLAEQFRVRQRGQIHEEHPVREVGQHVAGDLECQAGLAATADSGQGHQLSGHEQFADFVALDLAADEPGPRHRKLAPHARIPPTARVGEVRVMGQDGRFELAQLAARFDPQVLTQGHA
jgi:hypothetical protein